MFVSPLLLWCIATLAGCAWCAGWWLVASSPGNLIWPGLRAHRTLLRTAVAAQFLAGFVGGTVLLFELVGWQALTRVSDRGFFGLLVLLTLAFTVLALACWVLGFATLAKVAQHGLRSSKSRTSCLALAAAGGATVPLVIVPPLALLAAFVLVVFAAVALGSFRAGASKAIASTA